MSVSEQVKYAGDAVSVAVLGGTLLKWLPALAALFTIVWTLIRIWETKTVQCIVARVRNRK